MVPALYLRLSGVKDKSVLFANCPVDISQHRGSLQGKGPGHVVRGPPPILGPVDTLNSEAEGGNKPSPVCPLGPSSRLLPRSYFPLDIWLDTSQVRVHIPEFWVCAAFGALWVPPWPPETLCSSGVPGSRCYNVRGMRGKLHGPTQGCGPTCVD